MSTARTAPGDCGASTRREAEPCFQDPVPAWLLLVEVAAADVEALFKESE